jgi:hypothetical protein
MRAGMLRFAGVLIILFTLMISSGCAEGEVQRTSQTVEWGGAESARVDVTMAAGRVDIRGGAAPLLDAEFVYNVADWRPKVDYSVTDGRGELTIQQPLSADIRVGDVRYEWDLRLNNQVPIDLQVKLGAGNNTLSLSGLTLTNLEVVVGTGNVDVDLSGGWPRDFKARIRGGVGKAHVRLPEAVGVRVQVRGGLGQLTTVGLRKQDGAFVNDAYGQSDTTLEVEIQGGVGAVDLEVGG